MVYFCILATIKTGLYKNLLNEDVKKAATARAREREREGKSNNQKKNFYSANE